MAGLVTYISDDYIHVWSTSKCRGIRYGRSTIPIDRLEVGDWIEIQYNGDEMIGAVPIGEFLPTHKQEGGFLQISELFLMYPSRRQAFNDMFGFMPIEGHDGIWMDEEDARNNCYLLWMTVSPPGKFSISLQPYDAAFPSNGEYAGKFRKMVEAAQVTNSASSTSLSSQRHEPPRCEDDVFVDTIIIAEYDVRLGLVYCGSRHGDVALSADVREGKDVQIGDLFRAKIRKATGPRITIMYTVTYLYEKVAEMEGVSNLTVGPRNEVTLDLEGTVQNQMETCFCLETEQLGLVTYPFDRRLPIDLRPVEKVRVTVMRFNEKEDDHPSKWRVTRVLWRQVDGRKSAASVQSGGGRRREVEEEWRETPTSLNSEMRFPNFGESRRPLPVDQASNGYGSGGAQRQVESRASCSREEECYLLLLSLMDNQVMRETIQLETPATFTRIEQIIRETQQGGNNYY